MDNGANGIGDMEEEMNLISGYYDAMNRHDMESILNFLDENIKVTFPEAARDWEGKGTAATKFAIMYDRMPTFKAEYICLTTSKESGLSRIVLHATFTCEATKQISERDLVYRLDAKGDNGLKIVSIDHLP